MISTTATIIPQIKPKKVAFHVQSFISGKRLRVIAKVMMKLMIGYTINFHLESKVLKDI